MPLTFDFVEDRSLVKVALNAPFKADEVAEAGQSLISDPRLTPDCAFLVDCSNTDYVADTRTVRVLLQLIVDEHLVQGRRIALVVATDLQYGMGRVFTSLAQVKNVDANVFRSAAEAEEWLASPPSEE